MSLKNLLSKTVTDLGKRKKFSFGAGKPHTADQYGVGDVSGWIPSGIDLIDRSLGGGLPLGRISEIFSDDEANGKTTLLLQFAIQCQKQDGIVVLLDSEAALDRSRAGTMGLDLEKLITFGPETVEDGFEFIDALVQNIAEDKDLQNKPILIIWDTIAAAPTRTEKAAAKKEGDAFAGGMVEKPRIIAKALRNYVQEFFKYKVHLALVNQSITNVGNKNPYGPKYVTPGGKAIKFYATLRIKVRRTGYIGDARSLEAGDQKMGIKVTVTAVKNKLALPFQDVETFLYGNTGYCNVMSNANWLLANKSPLLQQKGGRYYLTSKKCTFWKGLREAVLADPEIQAKWTAEVAKAIPLPPNRAVDPKTGWVMRVEGTPLAEAPETEEAPGV